MSTKTKKIFFILVVASLAVRLVYFFQIKDHFLFKEPILDAKYYHQWAQEISSGDLMGKARGVFMMSPGYSYFLGLFYALFGVHIPMIVFLQFLMGILTGLLVYKLSKKFFNETSALLAMGFFLFYSIEIFYESTLLKTVLVNFLNVFALYLCAEGGVWYLFLSGLMAGFSVHLRPNALILVPVVLLWIYKVKIGMWRKSAVFILGFSLILMPVALRNLKVGGEFALSTAHGGMNFFTGNSWFCKGPYTPMPFARTDPAVEQQDFIAQAERIEKRSLTHNQSSEFWYRQSFNYIRNKPFDWVSLMSKKVLIFFNAYEPSINLDYYFFKSQYSSILSVPMFGYGLVLPLAVVGLMFSELNILLSGYLLVYFAANIVFFVVSEYRFPIVPVLCIYAGAGAVRFLELARQKASKKYAAAVILIFMFMMTNYDIYANVFGFRSYKTANLANSYFGLGVTYEDKGMTDKAIETYKDAIAIMPQSAPMINLANIYESRGRLDEAEELYKRTISIVPNSAEAFNNLGSIFYKKRDYLNAYNCFKRATELKPDFAEASNNLNITYKTINVGK
jgi:tetratricopeptide (TPR) repeat protein